MTKLLAALHWALANKAAILGAVAGLIAGASLFIKALEGCVSLLVKAYPSLQTTDGELLKAAAWLDELSQAPWLNKLALSPRKELPATAPEPKTFPPTIKPLVVLLLALGLGGLPSLARADVPPPDPRLSARATAPAEDILPPTGSADGFDWSAGPSVPFLEFDFGNPHPASIAPGAGVQVSITHDALKKAFLGKSWDLLDLQLMAFGSVLSSSSGQQFGALSAAAALCTMSSLVCLGGGKHLVSTDQTFTHGGWFMVMSFSFNFALGPFSPPTGIRTGAGGLVRANTLYF